jgi:DNA-binding CsgD family transcriptional regulator
MNRRGFLTGLAVGPLALATGGPHSARLRAGGLRFSPREREILALTMHDLSDAEIGRALWVSEHTVRTHMRNILVKVAMHPTLEAGRGHAAPAALA